MKVSLDIMYTRNGIYLIASQMGLLFVEVENDVCYQLTMENFERDGELRKGQWIVGNIRGIFGPFVKA